MSAYTELKRLADAAKDKRLSTLTIPVSVVLSMIAEIEQVKGLLMGALNQRDALRTQNQALTNRLEDANYLIRAFENGCDPSDYARDIEDYRAAEGVT